MASGWPKAWPENHAISGAAAQALRAILQTHYLRYLIIASWAVGLLAVVGPFAAALWFFGTIAAGALRGSVEKRISERVGAGWGMIFPAVATATTAAWAAAPLMAWFSGHPFGQPLAMTLLVSGYVLVFAQLRSSCEMTPRKLDLASLAALARSRADSSSSIRWA